jgi:hypothetical protein
VTAARIMGIESDHRTLARVVAPNVAAQDGGPIEAITGIQGRPEPVDPPNDNGYERTLGWRRIDRAVAALLPFTDRQAAAKAGFAHDPRVRLRAVHALAAGPARGVPLVRRLSGAARTRCSGNPVA